MSYEQFSDRARKVMQCANQEAQRFNHEYVAPEHILLGLIKEGVGVAASVLKNFDLDLKKIRSEVEKIVCAGPDTVIIGRLPHTPRAKKVLEYAMEEAQNLNHNYVGTEHILLGLLREEDGVAAQVLTECGLQIEKIRCEVLNLLGHEIEASGSIVSSGVDESKNDGQNQMILTALRARFKRVPASIEHAISLITDPSMLDFLTIHAATSPTLFEFAKILGNGEVGVFLSNYEKDALVNEIKETMRELNAAHRRLTETLRLLKN